MMRMREIEISLLVLALFLLKVSAKLSLPFHLPANETLDLKVGEHNTSDLAKSFKPGQCSEADGIKCPTGECCSIFGWCGTTSDYCSPQKCQSQCEVPSPPPPPPSPYQCGIQASGAECPAGMCCSYGGLCGTTPYFCEYNCQSQCEKLSPPLPPPPSDQCGFQGGGRKCPNNMCCSKWGWCGTTPEYCEDGCQSQCKTQTKNRMRGIESFLLNVV
ncbi:hypothetical protein HAX54_014075 [Datura stramonium]|uniref:Chitin-binding type-1 domain-containing protein n=1 Tax=Datura stramonium TaxID=4076 RepID=A0ABS8TPI4_DATST|nr:hypothetical protein [Datura stramonium]